MKKILLPFILLCVFVILSACSDKDEVSKTEDTKHNFTEFSLDVNYGGNDDYDASYDLEKDSLEVSIEDYRTKEDLRGDMAFEKLNPLLENLTFDATTPDDQVIAEVLSVFGLDSNYKEFDLDVTFKDGKKAEYKKNQ